jgi:hypothetical protein
MACKVEELACDFDLQQGIMNDGMLQGDLPFITQVAMVYPFEHVYLLKQPMSFTTHLHNIESSNASHNVCTLGFQNNNLALSRGAQ